MPDQRFVPKWMGKSVGVLAVVGLLAGAGGLFGSSCTDNSGNGKFVEPTLGTGTGGRSGDASPADAAGAGDAAATGGAGGSASGGAGGSASGGAGGSATGGAGGSATGGAGGSATGGAAGGAGGA